MKTHPQWLLMIIFSTVILFPQSSDARLFTARLIAVEAETFPHVQLNTSEEGNFSPENEERLGTGAAARLSKPAEDSGCPSFDFSPEDDGQDVLETGTDDQRVSTADRNDERQ